MDSAEWGSLLIALAGFFALGHLINHLGGSIYWWWQDHRAAKEDEKMLKDQEKLAENVPDNVVKLDEVRKKLTYYIDYGDDTIH
tara:strand:- start:367 stop:618 length:252 start_codon:yes stop_codon:yes gene_type:complete